MTIKVNHIFHLFSEGKLKIDTKKRKQNIR